MVVERDRRRVRPRHPAALHREHLGARGGREGARRPHQHGRRSATWRRTSTTSSASRCRSRPRTRPAAWRARAWASAWAWRWRARWLRARRPARAAPRRRPPPPAASWHVAENGQTLGPFGPSPWPRPPPDASDPTRWCGRRAWPAGRRPRRCRSSRLFQAAAAASAARPRPGLTDASDEPRKPREPLADFRLIRVVRQARRVTEVRRRPQCFRIRRRRRPCLMLHLRGVHVGAVDPHLVNDERAVAHRDAAARLVFVHLEQQPLAGPEAARSHVDEDRRALRRHLAAREQQEDEQARQQASEPHAHDIGRAAARLKHRGAALSTGAAGGGSAVRCLGRGFPRALPPLRSSP